MIKLKVDNPTQEKELFNLTNSDVPPGIYENRDYYVIVPEFYQKKIALWIWKNSGRCYSTLATEVTLPDLLIVSRSNSTLTISNILAKLKE